MYSFNLEDVTSVLLGGEWHLVADGSFKLSSIQLNPATVTAKARQVWTEGFVFIAEDTEGGRAVCGPVSAIESIRVTAPAQE